MKFIQREVKNSRVMVGVGQKSNVTVLREKLNTVKYVHM